MSDVFSRGPGRVPRRLVNDAGDVPDDTEVGRRLHVLYPLVLTLTFPNY